MNPIDPESADRERLRGAIKLRPELAGLKNLREISLDSVDGELPDVIARREGWERGVLVEEARENLPGRSLTRRDRRG